MDVAHAHVAGLERLSAGFSAYNVGRGEGVSVVQMVDAVERVTGLGIPRRFGPRRSGHVPALYADTTRAARALGLTEYANLDRICEDAWRWQSQNPQGYAD